MSHCTSKTRYPRRFRLTFISQAVVIESLAVAAILFLFFGMRADLNRQAKAQMLSEPTGQNDFTTRPSEAQAQHSIVLSSIVSHRFLTSERLTEFGVSCSAK